MSSLWCWALWKTQEPRKENLVRPIVVGKEYFVLFENFVYCYVDWPSRGNPSYESKHHQTLQRFLLSPTQWKGADYMPFVLITREIRAKDLSA